MKEMYNFKCTCDGKEQGGDYSRMSVFEHSGDIVQVDSCMVGEVKYLLEQGIKTVASCCGHRTHAGWIIVDGIESVDKMLELKYVIDDEFNQNAANLQCFLAKTTHDNPITMNMICPQTHSIVSMVKFESTKESIRNIEKFIGYSFPILNNDFDDKVAIIFDEKLLLIEGDYLAKMDDGTYLVVSKDIVGDKLLNFKIEF